MSSQRSRCASHATMGVSVAASQTASATRIRRKLEIGLDAVLAEEGALPLDQRRAAFDTAETEKVPEGGAVTDDN